MIQFVNDLMATIVLLMASNGFWLLIAIALCFLAAVKRDWKLEAVYVIVCLILIL